MDGAAIGVGTDVGGSIRIPSGYCGIYGFKPGLGRVSFAGSVGALFCPSPLSDAVVCCGSVVASCEEVWSRVGPRSAARSHALWAYFGRSSGFLTLRCFPPFAVPQVRTPASKLSARLRVPWAARSRTLNAWLASSLASAAVARIISPRQSRIGT